MKPVSMFPYLNHSPWDKDVMKELSIGVTLIMDEVFEEIKAGIKEWTLS